MATHCSIPAWKIPRTEEPCGLQSTGSQSWKRLSAHTHTIKNIQFSILIIFKNTVQWPKYIHTVQHEASFLMC